jgi:hypothetical protein
MCLRQGRSAQLSLGQRPRDQELKKTSALKARVMNAMGRASSRSFAIAIEIPALRTAHSTGKSNTAPELSFRSRNVLSR